jgi:hypothetical protein
MAPIIPAGGKKMNWVSDSTQPVEKKAQSMFEDDPQLSAIKDLPGMQDGIAELQGMTDDMSTPIDVPPVECPCDAAIAAPAAGGAVEQAVKKVEDAARAVADAAVADAEKAVTEAIKNVGKPAPEVAPVSGKLDEIVPEGGKAHEDSETPAEEAKEEHEKSETPAEEDKEEKAKNDNLPPGIDGEKEGKAKKEGDKDEKPAFAASLAGMKRIADLSASEVSELRTYWKESLGLPGEYVDAMLKKYTA